MGDAGSTMLGFSLAWMSIELSQPPVHAISPVVVLWIFALPIYDLFSSMFRRIQQGRSPFHGDSDHLHHILRRFGFSSRKVAQIVLIAAALAATIGMTAQTIGIPDGPLCLAWLILGATYHLVFGSGWVIKRRSDAREGEVTIAGKYWTIWKQR
jgi:UDP-GlcNAc:undecaprenyl-phosphate GlcNAc-1-phosphate transferase